MGLLSFFRSLRELENLKKQWVLELAKLESLLQYNMQTTKAIILVLKQENILDENWVVKEPKKEDKNLGQK